MRSLIDSPLDRDFDAMARLFIRGLITEKAKEAIRLKILKRAEAEAKKKRQVK
jgi:hypothetical protein